LFWSNNVIIWHTSTGCVNQSIGNGRSYFNISIEISNCFFSRSLKLTGNGGVIYVDGGSYFMNISYSMFYNTACSMAGGAFYFKSLSSTIRMVCANRCSCGTSYSGNFALIWISQQNHVEYLSVTNCSYSTNGIHSINLLYGNHSVGNTNSSLNKAQYGSGIRANSPSSFTSSLCTFSNNLDFLGESISFYSSGIISMSFTNIVHNNSPYCVFADLDGVKKLMFCVFRNNSKYLFCVRGGSIEVSHSFIDHLLSSFSSIFTTSLPVSTKTNNSFSKSSTYQIEFFKSYYCNAQLPAPVPSPIETLFVMETPFKTVEESPMKSLEETNEETMDQTLRVTHDSTIGDTLVKTIEITPISTLEYTPVVSIENTPVNSIESTPEKTVECTPVNTIEDTPVKTIEDTPMNTIECTPRNTIEDTPVKTIEDTPMNTIECTPGNTIEDTPVNTIECTPGNTIENTPMNTIVCTPGNTIEDSKVNNNTGSSSIGIVLVSFAIIIIIIIIIYTVGLILNSKYESSNNSRSKSDGNEISTI